MTPRHAVAGPYGPPRDPPPLPMEAIVRGLPTRQREIIVATYFRRWTTREAAEWLGITPAEAKARLYQAVCELADVTDSRPTATFS